MANDDVGERRDTEVDSVAIVTSLPSMDDNPLTVWLEQGKKEDPWFHFDEVLEVEFSPYTFKPDGLELKNMRWAHRPDLILIDYTEASSVLSSCDGGSLSSCSSTASFDSTHHYNAVTEHTKEYRNIDDDTTVSVQAQLFKITGKPRIRKLVDTNYRCQIHAPSFSVIRQKPLHKWLYHGHRKKVPCYLVAWCCNYKDPPARFSSSEVHSLIYSKRSIIVRGGGDSDSHASSSEASSGFSGIESSLESDSEIWDGMINIFKQNNEAGPSNNVNTSKSDSYNTNAQIGSISNTETLVGDITRFLNGSNGSLLIVSEHEESRSHDIDKLVGFAIGDMQIPRPNGFPLILPPASAPPPLTDGQGQPPAQIHDLVSTDFLKNPNGQYICPHKRCPPGVFSFQTIRDYVLHLDKHHKIKFYACGTCDARFNRKDNYTKHLNAKGHVLGQEGGIDWDAENTFIHNVQSIPVQPAASSPDATPQTRPPKTAITKLVQRTHPPRSSNRAPPSRAVTNSSAEDSNPANMTTSTKYSRAVPRTINPVFEGSGYLVNDSSAAEIAALKMQLEESNKELEESNKELEESKSEVRRLNRLIDRFLDNEDENMGNARKKRRLLDNTVEDQ